MKVLLVLSVLTIPILVSAQSYNYEDAINRTNAYILEFPDYNDYINILKLQVQLQILMVCQK